MSNWFFSLILDYDQPKSRDSILHKIVARRRGSSNISSEVARLIEDVNIRGDAAVIECTIKYDDFCLNDLRISQDRLRQAWNNCSEQIRSDLLEISDRISKYHNKQIPDDAKWTDEIGVELGWRWTPMNAAGIYVPGGLASYPSSVFMLAIPAAVAGVKRIVMTVPTPKGEINELVLAAAYCCNIDEVYSIGGAQAIAALAYGTQSIKAVDIIAGPGNKWVTEAKRQVFGTVGIDMPAGPTEVVIVADGTANPAFVAIDLIAQAEHDYEAQAILISEDAEFLKQVCVELEAQISSLDRKSIAMESFNNHGMMIHCPDNQELVELVNFIAPEHLQITTKNADILANTIVNAGAIFVGEGTPEVLGDYIAGASHVLPTTGAARFSSGVGVQTFMKRISTTKCPPGALRKIGPTAQRIAMQEGLSAHAEAIRMRLQVDKSS